MTTTAKPSRRFFQFSLATLLMFVAAICVVLAVRSNRLQKRRAAIAEIESLGGKIVYLPEWQTRWSRLLPEVLTPELSPLARLMGDDPSKMVIGVLFNDGHKITDCDLDNLKPLTEVCCIFAFNEFPISDAGLMRLASLTHLKVIAFVGKTNVTDAGIAEFQKVLPNCEIRR